MYFGQHVHRYDIYVMISTTWHIDRPLKRAWRWIGWVLAFHLSAQLHYCHFFSASKKWYLNLSICAFVHQLLTGYHFGRHCLIFYFINSPDNTTLSVFIPFISHTVRAIVTSLHIWEQRCVDGGGGRCFHSCTTDSCGRPVMGGMWGGQKGRGRERVQVEGGCKHYTSSSSSFFFFLIPASLSPSFVPLTLYSYVFCVLLLCFPYTSSIPV